MTKNLLSAQKETHQAATGNLHNRGHAIITQQIAQPPPAVQALYYFVHQGKAADWSLNSTPMQQDARVTDAIAVVGEAVAASARRRL